MAMREAVSIEALERAIRGRIAAEHGAQSEFVITPIVVKPSVHSQNGSNWSLELPQGSTPDCLNAFAAAAEQVGARLVLATSRAPFDLH